MHGPWVAKVLASFGDKAVDDQQRRVKIPTDWEDWLGAEFCGRVDYRRNFNRPTGLEPGQSVWIVVDQVDFHGVVFLNDKRLGSLTYGEPSRESLRIEVSELLRPSNVLRVEIEVNSDSQRASRDGQAGGLIGSVRIEIQQ